MQTGLADVRHEMRTGFADVKQSITRIETRLDVGLSEGRKETKTQFRWLMGGIGAASLTILAAILSAVFTLRG